MRRMVVAGIILACAAFFAGGAVQGKRQVGIEAAPTRTATPVEVINFPAVQAVSGSVQVNNLPVDEDGNLRVVGVVVGPAFRFIRIADGLNLTDGQQITLGPFPTGGWRRIDLYLRATGLSDTTGAVFCPNFEGLAGGDDFQFTAVSVNNFLCYTMAGQTDMRATPGDVRGPEFRLRITTPSGPHGNAALDAWIYLSN